MKKLRFLQMVVMESGVCLVSTISTKIDLIWFSGIGRENLIIIKHYAKHVEDWEDLFTQNTRE